MYLIQHHNVKIRENIDALAPTVIGDFDAIVDFNMKAKRILEEKDSGRPGHYYGRDMVIEGAMPVSQFYCVAAEYGGDPDWWRDDKKFQDYMKRHPQFNWLKL